MPISKFEARLENTMRKYTPKSPTEANRNQKKINQLTTKHLFNDKFNHKTKTVTTRRPQYKYTNLKTTQLI